MTAFAETTEAELYYACEAGAPDSTKETLGIATTRIGGGVVLSMREDTTGFWSKALGLGVTEPVTADLMREVVAFYQAAGTPRTQRPVRAHRRPDRGGARGGVRVGDRRDWSAATGDGQPVAGEPRAGGLASLVRAAELALD